MTTEGGVEEIRKEHEQAEEIDKAEQNEELMKKRKELFPHGHKNCYECELFIVEEAKKQVVGEMPFKRTIIGEERSMPKGTVVWFITDDERQSLKGEK